MATNENIREISDYIFEIKETMPEGIYLNMMNLLKDSHTYTQNKAVVQGDWLTFTEDDVRVGFPNTDLGWYEVIRFARGRQTALINMRRENLIHQLTFHHVIMWNNNRKNTLDAAIQDATEKLKAQQPITDLFLKAIADDLVLKAIEEMADLARTANNIGEQAVAAAQWRYNDQLIIMEDHSAPYRAGAYR
jgi:hypothetical protein